MRKINKVAENIYYIVSKPRDGTSYKYKVELSNMLARIIPVGSIFAFPIIIKFSEMDAIDFGIEEVHAFVAKNENALKKIEDDVNLFTLAEVTRGVHTLLIKKEIEEVILGLGKEAKRTREF